MDAHNDAKDRTWVFGLVAFAAFAVLAGVGIVSGRAWRLLLVPLAMIPVLRMVGAGFSLSPLQSSEGVTDAYSSALGDASQAGIATVFVDFLAMHLGGGECPWAPCAMTAAMAAAAVLPVLSGPVRFPAFRTACLLAAAVCFAVMPFAYADDLNIARLGSAFVMFVYAPTRLVRAYRSLKGGVRA